MCMCIHMHICISFCVNMRLSGTNYLIDEMGRVEVKTFTKSNFSKENARTEKKRRLRLFKI